MQMQIGRFQRPTPGPKSTDGALDFSLQGEQIKNYQQNRRIKNLEERTKIEDEAEGAKMKDILRRHTNANGVLNSAAATREVNSDPNISYKTSLNFRKEVGKDVGKQAASAAFESSIDYDPETGKATFDGVKFSNIIADAELVDGIEYRKKFQEYAKSVKDQVKDDMMTVEEAHNKASQIYNDNKGKEGDPDKEEKDRRAMLLAMGFAGTVGGDEAEIKDVIDGKVSAQDFADKWHSTGKYSTTRMVSEEVLAKGQKAILDALANGETTVGNANLALAAMARGTHDAYRQAMSMVGGVSSAKAKVSILTPLMVDRAKKISRTKLEVRQAWEQENVQHLNLSPTEFDDLMDTYYGASAARTLFLNLTDNTEANKKKFEEKKGWTGLNDGMIKRLLETGDWSGRFVNPEIDNAYRMLVEVYGRKKSGAAINKTEWTKFGGQLYNRAYLASGEDGVKVIRDNMKRILNSFYMVGHNLTKTPEGGNWVDNFENRHERELQGWLGMYPNKTSTKSETKHFDAQGKQVDEEITDDELDKYGN